MAKFPKEYLEDKLGDPAEIYTPHFRRDSRGNLVMPFTPYHRMVLVTSPGSKDVKFTTEGEDGKPATDPGSLKTGALYVGTVITIGPTSGWRLLLGGGDATYPIAYTDGVSVNFYVDKDGNVYLKGTIEAEAGGTIGGWSIGASELYAGTGASRVGLKPGTYPFYAGSETPASAPFRVNAAGKLWCTGIELLEGAGVGDLAILDQVDSDQIVDLSVTEGKLKDAAVAWEKIGEEAVKANNVWQGGEVITLSAQIKDAIILNAHIGDAEIQAAKIGSLNANVINAGIITSREYRTATAGVDRLEILASGYLDYITWWNAANNVQTWITDDYAGHLLIYAIAFVEIGNGLSVQGDIGVTGTVDGVDISNFATSYNTHVGDVSAHHSKWSNAISITPSSVVCSGSLQGTSLQLSGNIGLGIDAYINRVTTNYVRLTAGGFDMYKPIILNSLGSDPSGQLGMIFYHTGTNKLRLYGGSPAAWRDIAFA